MERNPNDLFSEQDIQKAISGMTGWEYDAQSRSIRKTFVRTNFLDAVAFIQKAAEIAERQDHHPDIFLHQYKRLTFTLSTHSAGGITQNDIDLATALDEIA